MPKFAANLTMMFNEHPFLDRFAAAADAGFEAVEFLFPYEATPDEVGKRVQRSGLVVALFNMPPGDWAGGERGLAALPGRFEEVDFGVTKSLEYAAATGTGRIHLMAGIADPGDPAAREAYHRSVTHCAERLAARGLELLLEPINGRDMPGYYLNDFETAFAFIESLGMANLKLQFDIYHRQIIHGDVTMALRRMMPLIGHIQIASVPARNEPDSGELDYGQLFAELDRLDYRGHVGCEYRPRAGTREGLRWFEPFK
jgi:hydroxypyruvate isomerase